MRYQVTLEREHPHTNLPKALRHLKTNLHWSKNLFRTRYEGENTVGGDGEWDIPDFQNQMRLFSVYYPHVIFHVTVEDETGAAWHASYLKGAVFSEQG